MNYSQNSQGVHADQTLKNILINEGNTAYRLTLFLWNPTSDAGAGSITFTIQWTKPFGGVGTATATINLASAATAVTLDETIWGLAGTPIQYSVLGGGTYGTATYSYLFAINDISKNDEGCGQRSIFPVPMPMPAQRQSCGCQKCQRDPCACPQQPQVIIVPQPQQQPFFQPQPFFPRQIPFRDDDWYNGPWGCEGCP